MQQVHAQHIEAFLPRLRPWLSWRCWRAYGTRQESKQRKQRPNRKVRLPLILTERVPNLGGKGEAVRVKRGYGRNYLLPQNKAVYYTPDNAKLYNLPPIPRESEIRKSSATERIRNVLARKAVKITVTEEEWALYEADIATALRTQLHLHVPLDLIKLAKPITKLGETEVNITVDDQLVAVRLEVVPALSI